MTIHTDHNLRAAIYAIYVATFNARQQCPDGFRDNDITRLLTALMGGKPWSWRVVGITLEALELFAKHDFKRPPGLIHRGHMVSRVTTARKLYERTAVAELDDFFQVFLKNDKTILMTKEQNRQKVFPKYIAIKNTNAKLFPNGSLVGWQHRQEEVEFLRGLYAIEHIRGSNA